MKIIFTIFLYIISYSSVADCNLCDYPMYSALKPQVKIERGKQSYLHSFCKVFYAERGIYEHNIERYNLILQLSVLKKDFILVKTLGNGTVIKTEKRYDGWIYDALLDCLKSDLDIQNDPSR